MTYATCYRDSQCRSKKNVEGKWVPGHALYGPFCAADHAVILGALKGMPWVRLQLQLAVGTKGQGEGGGRKSIHPAIPIRVEVDAMIREMDRSVYDWAAVTTREADLTHRPGILFAPACQLIAANIDYLYGAGSYVIMRWISENRVANLPDYIQGTVHGSGDAAVSFEATGAFGAVELMNIYIRACNMLRIPF